MGLAFGGQFRRENLEQGPDEAKLTGDIIGGGGPGNFTKAGRKTYAFYAEARLPVFGSEYSLPGFHALEFTAAARFEEFRNNDTNVLVPKVGVRWQPLDESLTLRSTWGEGFHEPSLIEFFGSPQSAAAQTANFGLPCWKRLSNGTTVTLGCNNVFGHDPPDAFTSSNYADFLYDSTGRFVYVSLQKRF